MRPPIPTSAEVRNRQQITRNPTMSMSPRFGSGFAVLVIGMALAAAAVAPARGSYGRSGDFIGTWITWAQGEHGECRRLNVTAESDGIRDGTWDAPGWNGLVMGALARDPSGTVWKGEWRDGVLAGSFALTLRGGDTFEGIFAAPGEAPRRWSGRRDTGGGLADVPCRLR